MTQLHPAWLRAKPADPSLTAIPRILEAHASERPHSLCLHYDDGSSLTYSEAWRSAVQTASALRNLGVGPGDAVLDWLPNGPLLMRMWFALNILGAIYIPINIAFRGGVLEHVVRNSGAGVMVCHTGLLDRLNDIDRGLLRTIIVDGADTNADGPCEIRSASVLDRADPGGTFPLAQPSDICTVLYTSGTTGLSKGVIVPYSQLYAAGSAAHGYLRADDRVYVFTPLFHTVGMSAVYAALTNGACIHLAESFHAQTFWADVREAGCNRVLGLISSMTLFLANTIKEDTTSPFDFAMMSPITEETAAFAKRQGFRYFAAYSMTEASVPILSGVDSTVWGSCGRPRTGIACRIVDADDNDVASGQVGELIIKSDEPGMLSPGYFNDPAATAVAWRNGWFHTGDAFRADESGHYYFVDRIKDAIRRRGENISSQEVEREIIAFPGVLEVAVIGVQTSNGDQEVMAVIAPVSGQSVQPVELIEFLMLRLAHFMIPRYLRLMPSLPKTPTNKIKKTELREEGVTADTWDRAAHGIHLKRQRLA